MEVKVDNKKFVSSPNVPQSHNYFVLNHRVESLKKLIYDSLPEPRFNLLNLIDKSVKRFSFVCLIYIEENNLHYPCLSYRRTGYNRKINVYAYDTTGQVMLFGEVPKDVLSGSVVGLTCLLEDDRFFVENVHYPRPLIREISATFYDLKIAVVSDLGITDEENDYDLILKLVDYINEHSLVILLGNSYSFKPVETTFKEWIECMNIIDISPTEKYKTILKKITVPFVVVPGFQDPLDTNLPQDPLIEKFVSCDNPNMFLSTNPSKISLNNLDILCFSREILDSIKHDLSEVEKMKSIIKLRLLVPSSLQNITTCNIRTDCDFILDFLPHIFISAGNNFIFEIASDVLYVSVPSFGRNHSFVQINLLNHSVDEFFLF